MAASIPIVSRVQEVVCIADVPYSFKDDKGEQRQGVTRKLCFLEFDSGNSALVGMFISKADPAFSCDLKRRGYFNMIALGVSLAFHRLRG